MRPCSRIDFPEEIEEIIIGLCPEMDMVEIKNRYNDIERTSFSVQILKCNNSTENGSCKSENEIA